MSAPASRNNEYDWTPRQREVLALIAAGKTNGEIGETLGISLDGAKWHVSEILSKLNADSREEAAAYWHAYQRPRARLTRALRSIGLGATALKWTAAGLTVGVGIFGAAMVVAAMRGGGSDAPAPPAATQVPQRVTADPVVWVLPSPAPPIATDCGQLDVAVEKSPLGGGGFLPMNITIAAAKPCRVTTVLSAELRWKDPVRQSEEFISNDGGPKPVALDLAQPQRAAQLGWSNWCGAVGATIYLHLVFDTSAAWIDVALPWQPSCEDGAHPSTLGWVVGAPGIPGP